MKFKKLIVCLCCICSLSAWAQNEPLPYFCGFEESTENTQWVLNADITSQPNLWTIGSATSQAGASSLYVSSDLGTTASYVATPQTVTASRTFKLSAGTYQLSFDWKAMADADSSATMYVCWLPATYETGSIVGAVLPEWVTQRALTINGSQKLLNVAAWKHEIVTVTANGRVDYKLVFVWYNNASTPVNPGGCIDNVQLGTTSCMPPTNLDISTANGELTFSWSGSASAYNLRYCKYGETNWNSIQNVQDTFYTVRNLENGVYSFWVQSICEYDNSLWSESDYDLYYDPSTVTQCIDYMNLDKAICTTGSTSNPYASIRKHDEGFLSINSQHTLHYLPDEYDPRTDGKLKTVPKNAMASVRLGNWAVNRGAESVSYKYVVDPETNGVLLLNYAIVLQNPGHNEEEQPRFKLEILKGDGTPVDKVCAAADFSAGFGQTEDWNKVGSRADILWKDWTTIGVNVQPYAGQTLTIRLTTYDCTQGGHYGYAYFTLDCAEGAISGISCGDNPTEKFVAPEGFLYRWYNESDVSNTLSTERDFPVPKNDVSTYYVDVIYPESPECFFTLSASARPRYPKVGADYTLYPNRNCTNEVKFNNLSYIYTAEGISTERCENMWWECVNTNNPSVKLTSTAYSPILSFPDDGGQYQVTVVAGLAGNLCTDTMRFELNLPPVGASNDTLRMQTCKNYYNFYGETIYRDGFYTYEMQSLAGCDSVKSLDIKFVPNIQVSINDTVCFGQTYHFGTRDLAESGTYVDTFTNEEGCDSTVTLTLEVLPELSATLICSSSSCDLTDRQMFRLQLSGEASAYNLLFSDVAKTAGFTDVINAPITDEIMVTIPNTIVPNRYNAQFVLLNSRCGNDTIPLQVVINYPATILAQRWNDVIGICNANNNGGFTFSAYQWYKDGNLLAGATKPYLYVAEKLDTTAYYWVELTSDAGLVLESCPMKPEYYPEEIDVTPTIIEANGVMNVAVMAKSTVSIYTASGFKWATYTVERGVTKLQAPSETGIYVVRITSDENQQKTVRISVKK